VACSDRRDGGSHHRAGLSFHALETHVSELWVAAEHTDNALLHAFMNEATGERVHRRLAAIGGYDLADNGREIAA
jgi:hypothetical protein